MNDKQLLETQLRTAADMRDYWREQARIAREDRGALLAVLRRIAAMDVNHAQAAILARNEARDEPKAIANSMAI